MLSKHDFLQAQKDVRACENGTNNFSQAVLNIVRTPMYKLRVGDRIGKEYVPVVEDVVRTLVIQVVVQALLAVIDPDAGFFSPVFWLILGYVVLGTLCYHLLFKKLIAIV